MTEAYICTPYNWAILLLGIYSTEMFTKRTRLFITALFVIAPNQK